MWRCKAKRILTVLVLCLIAAPALAADSSRIKTREGFIFPPVADGMTGVVGTLFDKDGAYVGSAEWVEEKLKEYRRYDNHLWVDEIGQGRVNLPVFKTILENIADEILLVDVRTAEEYITGHIPTAINIPIKDLKNNAGYAIMLKKISIETPVIFICATGKRAALAHQLFSNQPNFYYVAAVVEYQHNGEFKFLK